MRKYFPELMDFECSHMATEAQLSNVGNGIKVNFEAGRLASGHAVYHGKLGEESVTVKMVSQDVSEWNRVEGEIANMISLESHTNIVQYKASSSTRVPPNIYIAMEMCRSGTLENVVVGQEGKLSLQNQKIVMQHIINGLQHMHEHDILHTMLEPKHILQSLDGKHAKICDFGLSRVDGNAQLSISTGSMGDWGSPEVYSGKQSDAKSDVFSAGLIFHYILSDGKHPFGNGSLYRRLHIMNGEKMRLHLQKHPLRLVATNLIQGMLSFQQRERLATGDVLRHPFFWDEEMQRGCIKIVQKFLRPNEVKKLLEVRRIVKKDQEVNDDDGSLMVYILAHLQKQSIQIPKKLRTGFDEMVRPQPKYRELEDIDFGQGESIERRSGLDRICNVSAENQEPADDILETEVCKIFTAERYKSDKLVFAGKIKGVVEDPAAVKIMPKTNESLQTVKILQEIKDHQNIVVMKQHFEMTMDGKDLIHGLREGEKYICVAMEPCEKSLADALDSNPSTEYRKMLALHLIHALEFLQEKKIVHRQIAVNKIFLSKDKRNLKLIGWKKSSKETKWVLNEDIKAAADVLKAMVGRDNPQAGMLDDHHVFDHLYKKMRAGASASEILRHPFFWTPYKKLDFLVAVGDHFDARDDNTALEVFIRCCCDQDWAKVLKLKDAEKAQWFTTDDDGIVYEKATEMKNAKKRKYDSTSPTHLIRLIRNCANHLLDDCIKERRKHNYTKEQNLFRSRKDIWSFFSPRYPQLLCLVYRYIQKPELRQQHRFMRFFTEQEVRTTLNKVMAKKEQ